MLRYSDKYNCYDLELQYKEADILDDKDVPTGSKRRIAVDIAYDESPVTGVILALLVNQRSNNRFGYWANAELGSLMWKPENLVSAAIVRATAEEALKYIPEAIITEVTRKKEGWYIGIDVRGVPINVSVPIG